MIRALIRYLFQKAINYIWQLKYEVAENKRIKDENKAEEAAYVHRRKNNIECPHCKTIGCISMEEYRSHINISGSGAFSIEPRYIMQSCNGRKEQEKYRNYRMRNGLGDPRTIIVSSIQEDTTPD